MKWEQYVDMGERTTQAQPLTAQELDLRNFFQHNQVPFRVHPFWKVAEDQCFYVYDFVFHFTSQSANHAFNSSAQLEPITSPDVDLWLLECSYTTSKPANAKQYLRKRCAYFDRKFRAAKRRRFITILLVEALYVPPPVLKKSLPTLEYVDLLFTSVDAFKEWVLEGLGQNGVLQAPPPPEPLEKIESSDQTQTQLNGFIPVSDHSSTTPYVTRKRKGRKSQ